MATPRRTTVLVRGATVAGWIIVLVACGAFFFWLAEREQEGYRRAADEARSGPCTEYTFDPGSALGPSGCANVKHKLSLENGIGVCRCVGAEK
jgi:hypothetical protein